MADEKNPQAGSKQPQPQPQQSGTPGSSRPQQSGGSSGGGGEMSGAERDRRLRTGLAAGTATEEAAQQYEELGVDVRLDNRTGDQRPVLNPVLKPQQFDGPEVGHFGEHADAAREDFAEAIGRAEGDTLGMRSLGPIGRGEDEDDADQPVRSRSELGR